MHRQEVLYGTQIFSISTRTSPQCHLTRCTNGATIYWILRQAHDDNVAKPMRAFVCLFMRRKKAMSDDFEPKINKKQQKTATFKINIVSLQQTK